MSEALERAVPLDAVLGYLNFSEGRPDAQVQKALSDAYAMLGGDMAADPWSVFRTHLKSRLEQKHAEGASAFRDVTQAAAVIDLAFVHALPAYRKHHQDLLAHLSERELGQPFFLARLVEAVLAQGGPWQEQDRILRGAIKSLNDHVGYRPVAVLENRRCGMPYAHEWVRPIPLYIAGAGVAHGRWEGIITAAVQALADSDPELLTGANFEIGLLDELAWDPRGDDFHHPVHRRPNHVFGSWDPHHLDSQGRYRRYVARPVTLEILLEWVNLGPVRSIEERQTEAGVVLGGTILMASALSGPSPASPEANASLAMLVPRVAHCRDEFYASWLRRIPGPHGERLRAEAERTRQPFGGARSFLNQALARRRALQLQQKQLTLLWANLGYPERSRRQAAEIPVASVRMLGELYALLTTARLAVDRGEIAAAAELLPEVERRVQRGIACGALADPWNILGFQGQFPISAAAEDSVRDPRVEELLRILEFTFHLYARLRAEAVAKGLRDLEGRLRREMHRLADWWRPFAAHEVSDVPRVDGQEEAESADTWPRP